MRRLRAELRRLAGEHATGTLRLGDDGALHLIDGAVTHAESAHAPDLGTLLTASGRLTAPAWQRVRDKGATADQPTPARLSRAELQMYGLVALFDAVFVLSSSPAEPAFTPTDPHWLGPLNSAGPDTLFHEVRRCRERLDAAWPSPLADDAPVLPVRRLHRQRVILTGLQTELLLNADDRLTPPGLARLLGRTRFGCILAVRGLVASELLQAPAAPKGARVPRRRVGGAARRTVHTATPATDQPTWAPVDVSLLGRLQDALRELE
ncbi:MAG: hypothetical protein ABIS86_11975 [Streptosporangiaceae bacterium]